MVPPCSDRISRVPPYSRTWKTFTRTGPSPSLADRSKSFRFCLPGHWPGPRSLATTNGVSVDVLSSGYLDVSVRRVCLAKLYIHPAIPPKGGGFPHSEIPGSTCARNSPGLIATCYVLHRLSVPRHPPNALIALDRAKPSCAEINPNSMHRSAHRDDLRANVFTQRHFAAESHPAMPAINGPHRSSPSATVSQQSLFTMTKSYRPRVQPAPKLSPASRPPGASASSWWR